MGKKGKIPRMADKGTIGTPHGLCTVYAYAACQDAVHRQTGQTGMLARTPHQIRHGIPRAARFGAWDSHFLCVISGAMTFRFT